MEYFLKLADGEFYPLIGHSFSVGISSDSDPITTNLLGGSHSSPKASVFSLFDSAESSVSADVSEASMASARWQAIHLVSESLLANLRYDSSTNPYVISEFGIF